MKSQEKSTPWLAKTRQCFNSYPTLVFYSDHNSFFALNRSVWLQPYIPFPKKLLQNIAEPFFCDFLLWVMIAQIKHFEMVIIAVMIQWINFFFTLSVREPHWIQASRRVTRRMARDPTCLLLGSSFLIKIKQNLKVLKSRRQYNLFLEIYPAFKGLMQHNSIGAICKSFVLHVSKNTWYVHILVQFSEVLLWW